MSLKSIALAATTLVLSTSVNAAIISADWQSAGDNLITEDTVNELQWLDLTVTSSTSYNSVVAQMGSGGAYEGWTYATADQVSLFFDQFAGSGTYTGASPDHNVMFTNGLLHNWGATFSTSTLAQSYYIYDTLQAPGVPTLGWLRDYTDPAAVDIARVDTQNWADNQDHPQVGSALVRSSVVPIPAAAWLFGSGLLGLVGVARRKVRS